MTKVLTLEYIWYGVNYVIDNEQEEEIHKTEEVDISFGFTYYFGVQELIELTLKDPGIEVEHDANDEVKQLKESILVKKVEKFL